MFNERFLFVTVPSPRAPSDSMYQSAYGGGKTYSYARAQSNGCPESARFLYNERKKLARCRHATRSTTYGELNESMRFFNTAQFGYDRPDTRDGDCRRQRQNKRAIVGWVVLVMSKLKHLYRSRPIRSRLCGELRMGQWQGEENDSESTR